MTTVDTTGKRSSLLPNWVGRLLVVACWFTVLQGLILRAPHGGPGAVGAWAGGAAFLLAFPLTYERPGAVPLSLSGAGAVALAFTVSGNTPFVAAIASVAIGGRFLQTGVSRAIAAATVLGFIAALAITSHSAPQDILSPTAGLLFAYVAADALRRLREEQRQTKALLQEVIEGRDAQVRAAALDERSRLAREIHDILAHTLSALAVQLEGTRLLVEQQGGDSATLAALDRVRHLTHQGLDETKRAVGALRGDLSPPPELLSQVAADFQQDSGVPCSLQIEGQPVELAPEAQLALYRTAQEALTNVRKHASASSATISLRYVSDGVELTVENEGPARTSDLGGGGYGLRGLHERAALVDGRLEAGRTESGFKVRLWLPT